MFTINFFGDDPVPAKPVPVTQSKPTKKQNPLRKFWVGFVMDGDYSEDAARAAHKEMLKELGRE